eukprot:365042-Chlamydomonas_euryale.AAC.39
MPANEGPSPRNEKLAAEGYSVVGATSVVDDSSANQLLLAAVWPMLTVALKPGRTAPVQNAFELLFSGTRLSANVSSEILDNDTSVPLPPATHACCASDHEYSVAVL